MRISLRVPILLSLASLALAAPVAPRDDPPPFIPEIDPARMQQRALAIRLAFLHSWNGYVEYAWGYDDLVPEVKAAGNSRNGWGATIIDSMSTAIIMEMGDVVKKQLEWVKDVDWRKTGEMVNLFETTIRYLGGMISAYELLKGPYKHLIEDESLVETLLAQSVNLADALAFAFDTPTGIPSNDLDIVNGFAYNRWSNGLATIGTLSLEWTRLSDLTGNSTYAELVDKAMGYLLDPKPAWNEPFPGLLGTRVSLDTGEFMDSYGGWSGENDSFYEYLLKMYMYDPVKYKKYGERWLAAAESTMKYLRSPSPTRPDVIFLAEYYNTTTYNVTGHLTCFAGGNILLGGEVFNREDLKEFGYELIEGCVHVYKSSPTGIAPERWTYSLAGTPPWDSNLEFLYATGWMPSDSRYILRPEAIESVYHGYIYGSPIMKWKYVEDAWEMFEAIQNHCYVPTGGFAGLLNVMDKEGSLKSDYQESFWLAETLKYLYLIFAGEGKGGVGVKDGSWIFTTEAHPLRVRGKG